MEVAESFAFSIATLVGLTVFAPFERIKLIMQTKVLNAPEVAKNFTSYGSTIKSREGGGSSFIG
jgi:hypothetical protein